MNCPRLLRVSSFEVTGKTDEYSKDGYRMGKANKEDTMVFRLKDTIEEFKKVRNLSGQAGKEYLFQKTLEKILKDWDGVKFIVLPYKDSGTFIVGGLDDIQTILDDQVVKILSMYASPFVKDVEAEATAWRKLVLDLQGEPPGM